MWLQFVWAVACVGGYGWLASNFCFPAVLLLCNRARLAGGLRRCARRHTARWVGWGERVNVGRVGGVPCDAQGALGTKFANNGRG